MEDDASGKVPFVLNFDSYPELAASRFLSSFKGDIANGLFRDYQEIEEERIPVVRGSLMVAGTSSNLLRGSLTFNCRFEEFTLDTPVNRVLRQALIFCLKVLVDTNARREIESLLDEWFQSVGDLREADLDYSLPQHQRTLSRSFAEAVNVCRSLWIEPRNIRTVDSIGFLIRDTQKIVETAILIMLKDVVERNHDYCFYTFGDAKHSPHLKSSSRTDNDRPMDWKPQTAEYEGLTRRSVETGSEKLPWTFDPDIALTRLPQDALERSLNPLENIVGDVKYKIEDPIKNKSVGNFLHDSDRAQLLYFAKAFNVCRALAITFAEPEPELSCDLNLLGQKIVGSYAIARTSYGAGIDIKVIRYPFGDNIKPEDAHLNVIKAMDSVLGWFSNEVASSDSGR